MRRALPLGTVLLALALPLAAQQRPVRHVRVVLDLSISMRSNDLGRMALLSTLLLQDLARPNPSLGDSFEVIPFDRDWKWTDPAAPPVSTRPRIAFKSGGRADFVRQLQALPYDAKKTYFYPGLLAALDDLERASGGATAVRTAVLVTDGMPEKDRRDDDLRRLREELAPRLAKSGIRLYVLAFGGEADQNRDFFGEMVRTPQGASLGEYFVDPNGSRLLDYMQQIFARSFGFSPDAARRLPGTSSLVLDDGTTPEWVAVVVSCNRPQAMPRLRLTPPPGGKVNARDGVQSAGVKGGGYSLLWVGSPEPGDYGLDSDAIPGTVAVLRPTRLTLEVLPAPPYRQAQKAMAGMPFPLRIAVRSPTGAQGAPEVELSFRTFGERIPGRGTGPDAYAWEGDPGTPPPGTGTLSAQGRTYDIRGEFREHPESPHRVYVGYLEVEAQRGEAVVGALAGPLAHSIEVHPFLAVAPLPLSGYASSTALERRQRACTRLKLQLSGGRLPHPDRPRYPVRAVLVPSNPAVLGRELHQASFTLDGLPLAVEGQPGPQPGPWYKGRELDEAELLGEHQVCVQIGKPKDGDPARPLELAVAFTLLEDPYDDFRVIRPFGLKVLVAPPGLIEKWRPLWLTGLALLSVLALLWYLRDRPGFPADLGYAVGHEGSAAPLAARPLGEGSALARWLGWTAERAVVAPGEDRTLGRVRPVDRELYQLRPAPGVRVEAAERGETLPLRRGLASLGVHRTYRLRTANGSYLFRLEYR